MDVRPALACGDLVSAKTLLKVAVVLLGASVSMRAIIAAGPDLILGILRPATDRDGSSGCSTAWRCWFACGNSICGQLGDRRRGTGDRRGLPAYRRNRPPPIPCRATVRT